MDEVVNRAEGETRHSGEFLSLRLGAEDYGIGALKEGGCERILTMMDIEKLMSSVDMGPIAQAATARSLPKTPGENSCSTT